MSKDTEAHPWFKVQPRVRGWTDSVEWDSFGLWFAMGLWSADTGGSAMIPKTRISAVTARRLTGKRLAAALAQLIAEGQLVDHPAHWELTHWEQPPVEVWQDNTQRERWARNKRLKRDGELCRQIKARDRNLCRYCGIRVDWANHNDKSPYGGTYEHVDPDGENSLSNVVVGCRSCNCWKKQDRPLEHAEMALFRPGTTAAQIAAGATPMVDHRPVNERGPRLALVIDDDDGPAPGQPPASPSRGARAPARDSGPGQPRAGRTGTVQATAMDPLEDNHEGDHQ